MLHVRGVRKSFGDVLALDGVDLEVGPGEICGLLGPNGAGKTTLVSIVAGLLRPDAGEVSVDGVDVVARPQAARRRLGIAPQETGVYPTVRVRDNLEFFGRLAGLRNRALADRVEDVAHALELTELLDRPPRTLSGGEKRRVHTALAMMHKPPLLLLDEPTTGVDVRTRSRLLDTVRRISAADGTAVCYSTHYLAEVEALDATVAIIDAGRMIARGSVTDLVARHATSVLELTFRAQPPTGVQDFDAELVGDVLRVRTDAPASDLPAVLARLGDATDRLTGVEIVRPSLESAFLALTGRRFSESAA